MTAAEFLAARHAIGLSREEMAAEFALTPDVIDAFERGEARVPRRLAKLLGWHAALATRDAIVAASGLPECAEAARGLAALDDKADEALTAAEEGLSRHFDECPVCRARSDYADAHGPPLPELPTSIMARATEGLFTLVERLPGPLRAPSGEAGNGRRFAAMMASALSLFAIGIAGVAALSELIRSGLHSAWWKEPLQIALGVPVAYFVGFYCAGAAFDATRAMRTKFLGYVIRGGLVAGSVYGAMGLVAPLIDLAPSWSNWVSTTLISSVLGTFIGAGWWLKDQFGKSSSRAT